MTKDCIQDLFLGIWTKRAHLKPVSSVGAYLRICLRRKIIDILKKEQLLGQNISSDEYEKQFSYEDVIIAFQTEQETK